ncbi:MAG: DUF1553 domain-containing protein, partial [Verrucomicrobiae bacterium]|nr:DUF1553 domain-containing protein [Verrucomicrobiae bacterium]
VVDRLLDSPDFGPRWGRHWLDVARFAESSGYSRNMLYPHAWRYRNWVIEAHNRDLPYDDFVRAQIAGDLLPFDSPEQRDEQVTATAFLTIGPKTLNEGVPLLFHLNVADDQIDATCRAFLGLTANCARCHDHKYDPIPTRDYHAMAGIFLSSRNLAGTSTNVRAEHEEAHPLGKDGAALLERIAELTKRADDTQAAYLEVVKKRDELREPLEKKGVDWKKNPTPELAAAEAEVRAFQEKVKAAREAIPAPPEFTMAVLDAPAMEDAAFEAAVKKAADEKKPAPVRLADSPIYEKGLHDKPLAPVPRGVLTLLEKHVASPKVPAAESGRRQLAAWLTDPANPLTARVYVNRVWRHLFGAGIVETTDNFGLLGAKPSHPELLDDLARRFMDEGWSTKELIRSIVLSRTWMLDSTAIAASEAADPGNRWLWRFRPRRLEGEVIRDSLLFVGGTLDPSPLEGSQVAEIAKQQPKALQREIGRRDYYTKDATADVAHRSVYLPAARSALFDVMTIWDAPDPNLVVGERRLTTVPPQALFMMNSPLVIEQSRKAAESLLARMDTARADEKLTAASEAVLGRPPEPGERESLSAFLEGEDGAETDRWSRLFQALMATGEFRTVY